MTKNFLTTNPMFKGFATKQIEFFFVSHIFEQVFNFPDVLSRNIVRRNRLLLDYVHVIGTIEALPDYHLLVSHAQDKVFNNCVSL